MPGGGRRCILAHPHGIAGKPTDDVSPLSRIPSVYACRGRGGRMSSSPLTDGRPAGDGMARRFRAALVLLALCPAVSALAAPVGTAFTYQGRLTSSGAAATGNYDLRFQLYDALTGGAQVGSTGFLSNVSVTGGLFTANLDFGTAFAGSKRFLEIGVRPGGQMGMFTILTPRQELTPAPSAAFASNAAT